MIRLRWWEIVIGTVGVLVTLLWLAGGLVVPAAVLLLVLLLAAASRAEVVERQVAGAHARVRGFLALARTLAVVGLLLLVVAFTWLLSRREWSDETLQTIATFALAGLAIYVMRDMDRHAAKAVDHFIGGRFEQQVGRELEPLRDQGWTIIHNIPREGAGTSTSSRAAPRTRSQSRRRAAGTAPETVARRSATRSGRRSSSASAS